jgi:hypothetical protein
VPRAPFGSLLCALSLAASGCSVGDGVGEAHGTIHVPECRLDGEYDLDPDFFGAEFFEDGLSITMQHGGDYQVKSDGILFAVPDVRGADDRLGVALPIRFDPDATLAELEGVVRASLYLNESCDRDQHVGLVGTSGQVTFVSIGNGSIDEDDHVEGSFEIDFVEPAGHGGSASLEGFFRFRYTRGRPAQRFP